MKRITEKMKDGRYAVPECEINNENGFCYGSAIDHLAVLENYVDGIEQKQAEAEEKLEALRKAGKTKTVQFKELLGKRMMNENILAQLDFYGLKR